MGTAAMPTCFGVSIRGTSRLIVSYIIGGMFLVKWWLMLGVLLGIDCSCGSSSCSSSSCNSRSGIINISSSSIRFSSKFVVELVVNSVLGATVHGSGGGGSSCVVLLAFSCCRSWLLLMVGEELSFPWRIRQARYLRRACWCCCAKNVWSIW